MITAWDANGAGVVQLPSGRLVRGRGLRHPPPEGPPPTYGIYLLNKPPPAVPWPSRWLRWPDFWLPTNPAEAHLLLNAAWEMCATQRVEIACGGGRGRTGTALACLAVIDGVFAYEAVDFIREHYDRRAVETPWQKRYIRRFAVP
ncbi:MAG: protein phosphatase [Micromonosporaceae bacterium]|nr:protein phosphatase [Micromonosporaceae bacterium]